MTWELRRVGFVKMDMFPPEVVGKGKMCIRDRGMSAVGHGPVLLLSPRPQMCIRDRVVLHTTRVAPLLSAAQMRSRWATDFDAIAGTVPARGRGLMRASMVRCV